MLIQPKKVILWFVLITYIIMGLTWGGIFKAQKYGYLLSESVLFYPLYILGGSSATIASFSVLIKTGTSIKEWLKNVFGIKQKIFFYLLIIFFCACYVILGYITKSLTLSTPLWYLLLFGLTGIVEGGLEEAGWRYVLQPNLEKIMPFGLATLTTCVIWVFWHIPLFFISGTAQQNMNFGLFFLFFIGYAFSLAVIKQITGSVWLCVLFHSLLNSILTVFAISFNLSGTIIMSFVMVSISYILLKFKDLWKDNIKCKKVD
jgi:membrane protease YdiL (CAAX protease family)